MNSDRLNRPRHDEPPDAGDLGEAILALAAELVDALERHPESLAVALLLIGGPTLARARFDASVN